MSRPARLSYPRSALVAISLVVLSALGLSGCGDAAGDSDDAGLSVVASFYPLHYAVERVGGNEVEVTNLTKPGAEPHDLELAPQDVAALSDADLAVYLADFQPAVDDALASSDTHTLDVSDAADLSLHDEDGATDPHFWLDPLRLADVADAIAAELSSVSPQSAATFEENAADLRADLVELGASIDKGLARCDSRLLVTSHTAFGYLADSYGLEQVGLTGLTPDSEPTASDLAEITDFVSANDVTTIFYEALVSPDVAEAVAGATGADTAMLDPIEGLTDDSAGDNYVEVMQSNLAALREGLGCS
ncbi:MAG TPA: metal ABC transporter substrate-binding protein [Actinomycetes bacterium]|nr:metal ABC transporter substrate-binding protein [Actinomycetes bacterium]